MKKNLFIFCSLMMTSFWQAHAQTLPSAQSSFSLPSETITSRPDVFSLSKKIRECGTEPDQIKRLACYDRAHVDLVQYEANIAQNGFTWSYSLSPPVMSMTASLVNSFNTQLSQTDKTSMVIVCKPNLGGVADYAFYFSFNDLVAKSTDNFVNVKVTMDNNVTATWPMEISQSGKSIGFWRNVPDLKEKLSSMMDIKNLILDFKGPDEKTVHASFLLGNYRSVFNEEMKKACRF